MSFEVIDVKTGEDWQDIKIPGKFKIDDDKVYLKKIGNVLCLIPYHHAWDVMFDAVNDFSEDFMENRDQSKNQEREAFE